MMQDQDHIETSNYNEIQDQETQDEVQPLAHNLTQKKKKIQGTSSGLKGLSLLKKYNIYLNKDIEDLDDLLNIQIEIPTCWTIAECITYCIKVFNEQLQDRNISLQLSDQKFHWALYQAKKRTCRPKDEPNFAHDILVSGTGVELFSLSPAPNQENHAFINSNEEKQGEVAEQQTESTQMTNNTTTPVQQQPEQKQQPTLDYINNAYQNNSINKNQQSKPRNQVDDNEVCCFCFKRSKK